MVGSTILSTIWLILIIVACTLGVLLLISIFFKFYVFLSLRFKPIAVQSGELVRKKFFVCRDGYHLNWMGEINPQGHMILVGVHDLGMSREDFTGFKDYVWKKDPTISVVSFDQRNFGKNEIQEKRNAGSMILDLQDLIINLKEKFPTQEIVLVGEGLGYYVSLYVAARQPQVGKVIGVGLRNNEPYKHHWSEKIAILGGIIFTSNKLIKVSGEGKDLSSNPAFIQKIDNNLFAKGQISVREYFQHQRLKKVSVEKLSQLSQPVLVLQGQKDIYIDVQKTSKMLDKTISGKFTIEYFANQKHFLLNEPDNVMVFESILKWVK